MSKTPRVPTARPVDSRSADTRRRLVEAGLKLFGKNGLEAVTTRDLAKTAGVNLAAIPYHFGSKEGVYLAVAEFITEIGPQFIKRLASVEEALADPKTTKEALVEQLVRYVSDSLHGLNESPLQPPIAMFVIREQMEPTQAFDTLYTKVMGPAMAVMDQAIGRLLDLPPDHPDVKLNAQLFWAQQFFILTLRASLLRRMSWKSIGEAEIKKLTEVMAAYIRRQFGSRR